MHHFPISSGREQVLELCLKALETRTVHLPQPNWSFVLWTPNGIKRRHFVLHNQPSIKIHKEMKKMHVNMPHQGF
jgi:hypothetical protein